ncbi:UDP-N-acetylmuramoylalanine--D-glutamate ligase [Psychromonas ingrahamii 37]|uniref:UDP-N-acetylmuramoylalanine--D-glutamate ligase n=1 Tax=Psychromonas ingrahamii (strain DSM 17664 / CCUG 51855 / 37) TaxID=357804 RepID=A1SU17_PSYIN|nr:UDP-N-acetylmuramoyl-L-alanine--D-glutamate ligase [Psychromonas ingrahamii]ABM02982.1 UDP-N-acetylmuramoylalanine--D-glutamate ligase [Psychromonas ingrahamii 37]
MSNQQIAVLGLGETGLSCVNFLLKQGEQVTVFDTRQSPPGEDKLDSSVKLIKGELSFELLAKFNLIIASPGIALATPALQFALANGCEIIGDIELFARELSKPAYAHAKLVTISGSNGKSTVTSLLGEMAVAAKIKVAVGGNIGIPALDLLSPEIDLYILELSSFQLETTFSLNADIATLLNISEDHMDRYDSYAQYTAAKHRLYQQCKMALYNRDDKLTYPKNHSLNKTSFGFDKLAYGLVTDADKQIFLAKNGSPILAAKQLKLSGKHNWMNTLAAFALGEAVGLSEIGMFTALQAYSGLPHRCEFVAEINNVRWINDSKATNIGAAQAALLGLSETIPGNVHVILGGDGKGADFSELALVLKEIQGMIVCFGVDGKKIAAQHKRALLVENLEQAVENIFTTAQAGDLVILSPACASLDMYKNFMQRGDHFKRLVKALPARKN